MSSSPLWYGFTSLLLAALLFVPVSRLIWVMRVRALERRNGRPSSLEERARERRRARLWAGLIAITFAFLFNRVLLFGG